MELSGWELYFILKLDAIREFLGFFSIAGAIIGAVSFFVFGMAVVEEYDKKERERVGEKWKLYFTRYLLVMAILWPVFILMPSTKHMAAILVVPPIVNNEKVQALPEEMLDVLGLGLKKAKEALGDQQSDD